jgi:hypothetical protein
MSSISAPASENQILVVQLTGKLLERIPVAEAQIQMQQGPLEELDAMSGPDLVREGRRLVLKSLPQLRGSADH